MAVLALETPLERACRVHPHLPDDFHAVPILSLLGQSAAAGEADQVVQTPVHR